jgi:hypothetical protein
MIKYLYILKIPINDSFGINLNKKSDDSAEESSVNKNIIVQPNEIINDITYKVIHFNKKEDLANILNITVNTLNSLLSKRLKLIHTKNLFLKNIIVEKVKKNPKKEKMLEQENKMKNILLNVSKIS